MKFSSRCRQVIELVGRDGHTYEGAAEEMGLSESTVRFYARTVAEKTDIYPPLHACIHAYYLYVVSANADGELSGG